MSLKCGIVEVPDPRLKPLAVIAGPEKVIPAIVEFVDIAGLVAGASKGEGLGKPCLYVANVDEHGFAANPLLDRVREFSARENSPVVAVCAALEAEIADLPDEGKLVFLASH